MKVASFMFVFGFSLSQASKQRSALRGESRQLDNDGSLTQLELIDSTTDNLVMNLNLSQENIVNLQGFAVGTKFNINAVANEGADRVFFDNDRDEGKAPYARCSNSGDDFKDCNDLVLGNSVNVTATSKISGIEVNTLWAIVTFIEGTAAPTSSSAPTMAPTTGAPTVSPITAAPTTSTPTVSPITASPASTPPPLRNCNIPEPLGNWEGVTNYPLYVAEAQGAMVDEDFVIVGGFWNGFDTVTKENYALNVTAANQSWRKLADLPNVTATINGITVTGALTHAGFVVIGKKFYMCGGYIGGAPGPETDICLIYDHETDQWDNTTLPKLPDGRGGGAMIYSAKHNSLTFSAGSKRPRVGLSTGASKTVDYVETWTLKLDETDLGWVQKQNIPFKANHVGFVTAYDEQGNERHYFFGGHVEQNKNDGYVDDLYEWDADNETWIQRANLIIPLGHISSSTRPIGCGFLTVAGSTNNIGKLDDVYYYHIPNDQWYLLDDLNDTFPKKVNTPVCDFGVDGYLYCETGLPGAYVSYRRQFVVPE